MTNEIMQDMAQLRILYSNTSIIIAILIVTEWVVKQAAAHAQYIYSKGTREHTRWFRIMNCVGAIIIILWMVLAIEIV